MPRLKPAPGYITAKEAVGMLDISDATLSAYVKKGWLKRYGPPDRQHKFYKLSEIEALIASRNTFDEYQEALTVTVDVATSADMSAIIDIDRRVFHEEITEETYLRWMRKNPEVMLTLRDSNGKAVGFACILPMKQEIMDQFVKDEIGLDDISPDDVDLFEPGKPLHLYVMAICIDPSFRVGIKHEYGASLIRGLFTFLLDLGRRGVEIASITARSSQGDGIRLSRKMGLPQLHLPTSEKRLFSVQIAGSGLPILNRYNDLLAEWKQNHKDTH